MKLKLSALAAVLIFPLFVQAQDGYTPTSMVNGDANVTTPEVVLGGGLPIYTTLVDFQAAAPAATNSEDFEDNIAAGAFQICVGDINSATNNTCFTPGQIVDGININAAPPGDTVLLPPGFNGLASSVLGALTFASTTELTFSGSDVQAVAFDLYAGLVAADVDISVFDTSDSLIEVITVSGIGVLPDNQFIGFTSPVPIGRVSVVTQADGGELVDNLLFGSVVQPEPPTVPSLSTYGVLMLVGLFLFVFLFSNRKSY